MDDYSAALSPTFCPSSSLEISRAFPVAFSKTQKKKENEQSTFYYNRILNNVAVVVPSEALISFLKVEL